jgi:intracellular multiplication protein IcmT
VAGKFSADAHWRDTARSARFFFVDYRAAFPLLLFLLHIEWWTFFLAVGTTLFLSFLERYGFTVVVFKRWARSILAGSHKMSRPWWRS